MADADIVMAADAEATLPLLIDEVKRQLTRGSPARARRSAAQARRDCISRRVRGDGRRRRYGWDSSPVSLARLCCASSGTQIQHDDWSLVSWQGFISGWPGRLWNIDKHYHYIGGQGAGAMGYGAPRGRSARRSPIASTAGCRSTSRPTAI